MSIEELEAFIARLGLTTRRVVDTSAQTYTVIERVHIPSGPHAGKECEVALQHLPGPTFVMPAAVHIRPHLLPMQGGEPYGTQASALGSDWQYWSRRLDGTPTPERVWAHIVTVLTESRG